MKENKAWSVNGFVGLLVMLGFIALAVHSLMNDIVILGVISIVIAVTCVASFTVVQPNQAQVITFFGKYMGSIRNNGFWMTVPFSFQKKVSLRVRNFNSVKLKVNDIEGNPIEIAAVVVFRVTDSAKALFEVENYEVFVDIQSETALRQKKLQLN